MNEKFIVKHYVYDKRPSIKGNGFDGLEIGEDRDEAQEFIDYVNTVQKEKEELVERFKNWLMVNTSIPVERIVYLDAELEF